MTNFELTVTITGASRDWLMHNTTWGAVQGESLVATKTRQLVVGADFTKFGNGRTYNMRLAPEQVHELYKVLEQQYLICTGKHSGKGHPQSAAKNSKHIVGCLKRDTDKLKEMLWPRR